MKLTPPQIDLIRTTFALLEPKSDVAALAFYQRLFTIDPSLRSLVHIANIDAETEHWMALLRAASDLADQPQALQARFARNDTTLCLWKAGQHNPAVVGEALLWSLGTTLGQAFTPEARDAWAALVATVTVTATGTGSELLRWNRTSGMS